MDETILELQKKTLKALNDRIVELSTMELPLTGDSVEDERRQDRILRKLSRLQNDRTRFELDMINDETVTRLMKLSELSKERRDSFTAAFAKVRTSLTDHTTFVAILNATRTLTKAAVDAINALDPD